jgi:hypothetical protein
MEEAGLGQKTNVEWDCGRLRAAGCWVHFGDLLGRLVWTWLYFLSISGKKK